LSINSRDNALLKVQLRDFVLEADNIADYAEDVSDELLVFVAKGYS